MCAVLWEQSICVFLAKPRDSGCYKPDRPDQFWHMNQFDFVGGEKEGLSYCDVAEDSDISLRSLPGEWQVAQQDVQTTPTRGLFLWCSTLTALDQILLIYASTFNWWSNFSLIINFKDIVRHFYTVFIQLLWFTNWVKTTSQKQHSPAPYFPQRISLRIPSATLYTFAYFAYIFSNVSVD